MRKQHYRTKNKDNARIRFQNSNVDKMEFHQLENIDQNEKYEGFENEELLKAQSNIKYKLKISNASFDVSDVQGIIFGGLSSRFWVYRKHLNLIS